MLFIHIGRPRREEAAPPAGSGEYFTDEFDGAALGSNWQQITTASPTKHEINGGVLTFQPDGVSNAGAYGYRHNAPNSGDFFVGGIFSSNFLTTDAILGVFAGNLTSGRTHVSSVFKTGPGFIAHHGAVRAGYSRTANWGGFLSGNGMEVGGFFGCGLIYKADDMAMTMIRNHGGHWQKVHASLNEARPDDIGMFLYGTGSSVAIDHTVSLSSLTCSPSIPVYAVGVFASSTHGSSSPEHGFDGTPSTRWVTNDNAGFPAWLGTNFSAPYSCSKLLLTLTNDAYNAPQRDPRDFQVQGSNDGGATWSVLGSFSGVTWDRRGETKEFTMTSPGAYSKLRLYITAQQGNDGYVQVGNLGFAN